MSSAKTTTHHDTIKQWVEQRGGHPARVKGTGDDGGGLLRIDFPGYSGGDTLEAISWDEFLETFDANQLAFLYQDEPNSRFSKLISRERDESEDEPEEESEDAESEDEPEESEEESEDAISLLEGQHREVEALFEQLAESTSARRKAQLFAELADNLAAHAKIEESMFYPGVCDHDTSARLHESVEDHLAVKRVLAELLEMEASDSSFMKKIDTLESMVRSHVEEEESELFAQVRDLDVDLEDLGRRMKRRFAQLINKDPRKKVPSELAEPAPLPC